MSSDIRIGCSRSLNVNHNPQKVENAQTSNTSTVGQYIMGQIIGFHSDTHPHTKKKYTAICFSPLYAEIVKEQPRKLKEIIDQKRLACLYMVDNDYVKVEMNKIWHNALNEKNVEEIICIRQGRYYDLLLNMVEVSDLSPEAYRELEDIHVSKLPKPSNKNFFTRLFK